VSIQLVMLRRFTAQILSRLSRNRRVHPRVDIDGKAFWSGARVEGSGRILDLSAGGVGIADPELLLPVGTRVHVTLAIGNESMLSLPAEVMWAAKERLGLRFGEMRSELRERLEVLIREVIDDA
jgi:hypothetical protein